MGQATSRMAAMATPFGTPRAIATSALGGLLWLMMFHRAIQHDNSRG